MKYKFLPIIIILSLIVDGSLGCSKNDLKTKKETEPNTQQQKSSAIKQNKELTKKVKNEKGVLGGQVYEQNGIVVGTLVLDKKVSDKDAKKLTQKYLDEIKIKYKDKKANVQAVRNGKNVANITK